MLVASLALHLLAWLWLAPFGRRTHRPGRASWTTALELVAPGPVRGAAAGDGNEASLAEQATARPAPRPEPPRSAPRRSAPPPRQRPAAGATTSEAPGGERGATPATPADAAPAGDPSGADDGEGGDESVAPGADPGEGLSDADFIAGLIDRPGGSASGGMGGAGASGGAGCDDPILGTWRARRYDRRRAKHATFTLRITGREGGALRGTIHLRSWGGGAAGAPTQSSPPRCQPGVFDHTVRMPARGALHGDEVDFEALAHTRVVHCMDFGRWIYHLDHFRGRVSGDRLEAVNNDGGAEVDTPYTFRRVSCR